MISNEHGSAQSCRWFFVLWQTCAFYRTKQRVFCQQRTHRAITSILWATRNSSKVHTHKVEWCTQWIDKMHQLTSYAIDCSNLDYAITTCIFIKYYLSLSIYIFYVCDKNITLKDFLCRIFSIEKRLCYGNMRPSRK